VDAPRAAIDALGDAARWAPRQGRALEEQVLAREYKAANDAILCLFDNPYRPVALEPGWRAPEVVALAQSIYDERAFDRMGQLATALRKAGCADQKLLGHCREKEGHVRGCWALDLLLEKPLPVAPDRGPALEAILREVSEVNLHGRPVPPVLRALWAAQLEGENILALSDVDNELFAGKHKAYEKLYLKAPPDKKVRRAYEKMFQEIGFIGHAVEPQMFGYWFYDDQVTVERAPMITLNSEGSFHLCDANLQDYLLLGAYEREPENVPLLRRWFKEHDIPVSSSAWFKKHSAPRPRAEWDALLARKELPDPEKRFGEHLRG
jgi:hypothetical protein